MLLGKKAGYHDVQNQQMSIRIDRIAIETVRIVKYLGVFIDRGLSFKESVLNVLKIFY